MRNRLLMHLWHLSAFFGLVSSCRTPGPLLDICTSMPGDDSTPDLRAGLYCVSKEQERYFVHYLDSRGYTCLSPDDYRILTDWIRRHTESQPN